MRANGFIRAFESFHVIVQPAARTVKRPIACRLRLNHFPLFAVLFEIEPRSCRRAPRSLLISQIVLRRVCRVFRRETVASFGKDHKRR